MLAAMTISPLAGLSGLALQRSTAQSLSLLVSVWCFKIVQAKAENTKMLNQNIHAKPKPKPTLSFKNCSCVCVSLYTTVVHNTAQNSSDNFPSYPPDNHHCSDDVYWRGGNVYQQNWTLFKMSLQMLSYFSHRLITADWLIVSKLLAHFNIHYILLHSKYIQTN